MAIVPIDSELYRDKEIRGAIARYFDNMEFIGIHKPTMAKVFRVSNDEVPLGDVCIRIYISRYPGIHPMVTKFEIIKPIQDLKQ